MLKSMMPLRNLSLSSASIFPPTSIDSWLLLRSTMTPTPLRTAHPPSPRAHRGVSSSACHRDPIRPAPGPKQKNSSGQIDETLQNDLLKLINQHILFCLHHPTLGYYSRTDRVARADPFGRPGDFITSPEITQVFGELIAIWFISRWQARGSPSRVRIIELGPGRGTLMADIIRTFKSIQAFKTVHLSIRLVENSPFMRELQKKKLCGHAGTGPSITEDRIAWFDHIDQVGKDDERWTMIIAHEFFDALPVHIFQKTEMGFREVMVDIARGGLSSSTTNQALRFVLSPGPTLASETLVSSRNSEFQKLPMGSKLEISPSSVQVARQISEILQTDLGGTGLIVDYGADHRFSHSLRGFYQHQIVDPLSRPGLTDITTNVDFASVKRAMNPTVNTYGPITQRQFLLSMGIEVRSKRLNQPPQSSSTSAVESCERLISPLGMGEQYKFLGFERSGVLSDDNLEVYPFPRQPDHCQGA